MFQRSRYEKVASHLVSQPNSLDELCYQLIQHIIATADLTHSVEEIIVTALVLIWWIDTAWKSITEETIKKVFKASGFTKPSLPSSLAEALVSLRRLHLLSRYVSFRSAPSKQGYENISQ